MDKAEILALRNDAMLLKELTALPAWRVLLKYADQAMNGAMDRGFHDPHIGPRLTQYFKGVWAGVHDTIQIPEYIQREAETMGEQMRIG